MIGKEVLSKGLSLVAVLFLLSASTVLGQPPCEGDLNCDGQVTGADTVMYKADYNRTPYLNEPCPEWNPRCIPSPLPKTGQTTSYDSTHDDFEDGDLERGVEWPIPRFTDNGDGTITDNLTGLIWLKDANCIGIHYASTHDDYGAQDGAVTWGHALDLIGAINSGELPLCSGGGKTDWRLPNVYELSSLLCFEYYNPALSDAAGTVKWTDGDAFENVAGGGLGKAYWTSTTFVPVTTSAITIGFYYPSLSLDNKTAPTNTDNFVWPVRGGE